MATTLPVSRLQRDLSDSSLLRNGGVVVGHSLLAVRSALRGLGKIEVDAAALGAELEDAWEVLAEAVQTVMRKRGGEDPYDQLKALTRGARIDRDRLASSWPRPTSTRTTGSACSRSPPRSTRGSPSGSSTTCALAALPRIVMFTRVPGRDADARAGSTDASTLPKRKPRVRPRRQPAA